MSTAAHPDPHPAGGPHTPAGQPARTSAGQPATTSAAAEECLRIRDLSIAYGTGPASVAGVDLRLARGEILGIIGESGCGKSSIGLAMLGLLPASAQVTAAEFTVAGHDFIDRTEAQMRDVRGNDVSMIFQEPMSALNPLIRIGDQIEEVLLLHNAMPRAQARARALEILRLVQVPEPELRMRQFPHQLSGGMRQRIVIAIAMAAEPQVLVADEPTTALDVTVQAQILTLLSELRERTGTGIVLISHDLGVIAHTCDRVVVMYAGQIVEEGTPEQVLRQPGHPYTIGLIGSIPVIDTNAGQRSRLQAIPGRVQESDRSAPGCRFASRCAFVQSACHTPQTMRPVTRTPAAAEAAVASQPDAAEASVASRPETGGHARQPAPASGTGMTHTSGAEATLTTGAEAEIRGTGHRARCLLLDDPLATERSRS